MKDYYRLLEVDPEASQEVINNAYRALVKKHHPDRYHTTELRKKNDRLMQEINEAYLALSTMETRRAYDRKFERHLSDHPRQEHRSRQWQQTQRFLYWFCLVVFAFLVIRTAGRVLLMMGVFKWVIIGLFAYAAFKLWRSAKLS